MLKDDEFYMDGGFMVLTEAFHLRRGSCCGNGCRHCPYGHAAVPKPHEVRTNRDGE